MQCHCIGIVSVGSSARCVSACVFEAWRRLGVRAAAAAAAESSCRARGGGDGRGLRALCVCTGPKTSQQALEKRAGIRRRTRARRYCTRAASSQVAEQGSCASQACMGVSNCTCDRQPHINTHTQIKPPIRAPIITTATQYQQIVNTGRRPLSASKRRRMPSISSSQSSDASSCVRACACAVCVCVCAVRACAVCVRCVHVRVFTSACVCVRRCSRLAQHVRRCSRLAQHVLYNCSGTQCREQTNK